VNQIPYGLSMATTKTKITYLKKNQVVFLVTKKHHFAIVPIAPQPSNMRCDNCGTSQWNAHNLGNTIHICPNMEIEVEFPSERISVNFKKTI